MAELGNVVFEKGRGWHIDFGMLRWPGAPKLKRVRVTHAQGFGRLKTDEQCAQVLAVIRERARACPVQDILAEYLSRPTPENCVPHRWTHEFISSKQVDCERGELSKARLRDLRNMPQRGYLAFWDHCPPHRIDTPAVMTWYDWLRANFPHLGATSIKHAISDFRTFCRFMKRRGALQIVPDFPVIKVPKKKKSTPKRHIVAQVIGHIARGEQGLWMARGFAGLRPTESRRVDVVDYDFDTTDLTIPAEKCKTKTTRVLRLRRVAPELVEWLEQHRKGARPWEPLFPAPRARDKRWKNTPERRVLKSALSAAGYVHVAPNIFGRHSFATHEVHSQTDIYAVSKWLGHGDIKTTEAYLEDDAVALERRMRPLTESCPKPKMKGTGQVRKLSKSR